MRMWKVNPKLMCRKHLLGEHLEMHMFVGCLKKGKSLVGYIKKELVELHFLVARHHQLATEMVQRGYNHNSPIGGFPHRVGGKVDTNKSLKELSKRCPECRRLIKND